MRFLTIICLSSVLASCTPEGWTKKDESNFMAGCQEGFEDGFSSGFDENNPMDESDQVLMKYLSAKVCACSLEKVKEKHSSARERIKAAETQEIMEACIREIEKDTNRYQ